jgi:hypothetical protein
MMGTIRQRRLTQCNSWGIQNPIAILSLEAVGSPEVQNLCLMDIQNRVWTADRLEKRGWQNCRRCKLCNQVQESASHLLFKCRFTIQVWTKVKDWLGLHDVDPSSWHTRRSIKEWWMEAIHKHGQSKKVMGSLVMLIS